MEPAAEGRTPKAPMGAQAGIAGRLLKIAACATSEDELLSEFASALQQASGAEGCDLLLAAESEALVLRASTYAPDYVLRCRLGRGVGLSGQVFLSGVPIFLSKDADKDPRNIDYPGMEARRWGGQAVLPLEAPSGRIGVCLLYRKDRWQFPESKKRALGALGASAAMAFSGFRNAYGLGARSSRIGALTEVTRNIAASPYLEEILQLLVTITAQQFDYRVVAVRLLDETRGELVLRATQAPAKAYQRKRAIKLGESIAGRAIDENRPIVVPDVQVEPDYIGHDLAVEQGLRSMICLPLVVQDRPIGVMTCYTGDVRDFPPDEVNALETVAKQAAMAIEHTRLQVRSTLLQEVHHRVKNSLQQIASLLRLQMRHGEYKALDRALDDSLSRILAIAAVHELLSREDLDHVGMRSLSEALIQHQRETLILPDRSIRFQVRGDDVHLNTTQAAQVALILNELIQNAVEHGFKETREGEIHVTVERREDEVALWVSNNGDRLPEGFDAEKHGRLGVQIVDSLTKSLGGRFKLSEILGWAVAEVKFTLSGAE